MPPDTTEPESIEVLLTCTSCGEPLDQCEIDDPRNKDEPELCDDCYSAFYEFVCCWCEDMDSNDYQHVLLVVFDAKEAYIALPGIYRIDETPYYSQPLVGAGRLWADCLTWLGYLPGCHADRYPCGHLCRTCQAKALADCLYQTRCGALAALSA